MSKVDQLRAEFPEDFTLDLIESESDALEILDAYAEAVIADEALAEAARERAKRLEARATKGRERMVMIIENKLPRGTVERALYTASLAYTQKAIVTDEDRLPADFFVMKPDARKVLAELRKGAVPGAELSNLTPHLVLRTK